jgi:hypothetical protein
MRKAVVAVVFSALMVASSAVAAGAQPNCTGNLEDRPSSCFNSGPGQPGFHGK